MSQRIAPATEHALRALNIDPQVIAHRTLPFFDDVNPDLLVIAETDDSGKAHRLTQPAATAWQSMKRAAEQDGVVLLLISAWRDRAYQSGLIRQKLQAGVSAEKIFTSLAPPGCSEHHTGRAVDINTPDCDEVTGVFGETEAFRWLNRRASDFGFTLSFPPDNPWGFIYEPWHWCWNP
jgi:D-alanyl-D-alanine carboxypeptidase